MAADELAEIDGHKPKVLLADGQGREIKSTSSTGATYKIKRTQDSYYCHCPAWRNQKGVPVNARTCKHLRDVLGDEYETARLELKNPNGAPPKPSGKGAAKVPSTSKPASRGKRKRDDDSNEDEEADEEEDDAPSPKKGRKFVSKKTDSDFDEEDESEEEPAQKKAKNKSKGKKKADSDAGEDSEEEPRTKTPRKAAASKPKSKGKKKADPDSGEESDAEPRVKKSATKGKGKKTAHSDSDDDSDERPAKKMKPASKGKGKKKADSDDDDDERPAKKSKPASKAKGRKKPDSDDDDEDDERPAKKSKPVSKAKGKKKLDSDDEDDERPAKKMKPTSKGKGTKVESDSEGEDEDEDVKPPKKSPTSDVKGTSKSSDPLAEIDGHKPKVLLDDGEDREIQSMSSNSTYKVKRTWDHYYCQCPAWRNQAGSPVDARTCKHLRDLLGDAYEAARIKWKNPNGPPLKPASKKGKAKSKPASKGKRKRDDDDDDDEDDKKPKSKSKRAKVDDDDDDDEDDSGGKKVPALLLANKWDIETGPDPTGWWISEKLDGVRTFYDGEGMVSRLGNPFTPPQWFLDKLPTDVTLDGELFGGRGKFQDTVSIVKTMNSPHWKGITFQIFDVPSENTVFEDRVAFLQKLFGPGGKYECPEVVLVEHEKAKSRKHVLEKLKEIEELGGEGLMLRRAGSKYEGRRSGTLLKIKTFYDGEAEVTGYTDGKGKHVGLTGALKCKMESGKTFNVGTGLSDKQRKNPPKIGSIITYRFQELTRDGVPRFPSYIGEAIDKKRAKDAKLPAHRKIGAKKDD